MLAPLQDEEPPAPPARDAGWLTDQLAAIWASYFTDVPRVNAVEIGWWRPWKTRLGLITLREPSGSTFIGVNRLLQPAAVPEVVTTVTIAHELVHYGHGFGSPLPRRHAHPHRGGIVDRELRYRGLAALMLEYARWIDAHWFSHYATHMPGRRYQPSSQSTGAGRELAG